MTVYDAKGTVLATGALAEGTLSARGVAFEFGIENIPDRDMYQVEVSHRGKLAYSRADLEGKGWQVDLTLGD